ncbi:MAG: valine--tRNA ligase [Candidatus Diapherotrites archaeon]|nr:valine--tRNA ligase [Candidatus Diapherotrites archaeon]
MPDPKLSEKRWDKAFESELFKQWQRDGIYSFDKRAQDIFSIDTPPPYASGTWHMGGAAHYSQIDMIARVMRMFGKHVLFPFGVDRNGLPIEVRTEQDNNISMHDVPREEFIAMCKKTLDRYKMEIAETAKRLGLSCNAWDVKHEVGGAYTTDDPEYRRLTQATFLELWKRGLIYEDNRPNNYCPVCRTTIADAEIEYTELPTKLNSLRFRVKESGEEIIIATTRPEMLASCQAVLFNPSDERYQHLEGKHAIIPLYDRAVPLMAHPSAKPEYGSGLVMVCSYGDYTDVLLFRELGLEEVILINPEGRMTERVGKYAGLTPVEARKAILHNLDGLGFLVKQEQLMHNTPTCWRSKNPLEIIPMPEYYLKQTEFIDDLREVAKEIRFHAPVSKNMLDAWLDAVSMDWPISRRRYYATEVPLWYCEECGKPLVPKPGKYYQPWREGPPAGSKCECGSSSFRGEERVFDTWMDSSISEVYILGKLWDEDWFGKHFPCSLRAQGKDIVRTWLYYTLLRAYQLFKKRAFDHVWISHHIIGADGRKMSKSLGNVVMPNPMLDKYGADTLRLWSCMEASFLKSDLRCSEERIAGNGKFLTKLWNTARFISSFPEPAEPAELQEADKWILAELESLKGSALSGLEEFDFFVPASGVWDFVWNKFAPHYIELVKKRAYDGDAAACWTLHECMRTVLKLMAPMTPYITDKIWLGVYSGKSIHLERFPEKDESRKDDGLLKRGVALMDFNSCVWKQKKDAGQPLNSEVSVSIPANLSVFADDLKRMHNIT